MIHIQLAENIGQDFSKDVEPQFLKCRFSFQKCHMPLQNHLMLSARLISKIFKITTFQLYLYRCHYDAAMIVVIVTETHAAHSR